MIPWLLLSFAIKHELYLLAVINNFVRIQKIIRRKHVITIDKVTRKHHHFKFEVNPCVCSKCLNSVHWVKIAPKLEKSTERTDGRTGGRADIWKMVNQGSYRQALKIFNDFQWYFKTKIPNCHDNSECYKMKKHRTILHMVSSHMLWPVLGVFKKICNVFLLYSMKNHHNHHIIISIFTLGCCPCPIQWGWQYQAMPNTGSPSISALLVNPGQATITVTVLTHLDHVFLDLPFPLGPGSGRSVTDLIQDVAHCTSTHHISRPLRKTAVISLMPSFWGCFNSVFGATDPADHGVVIAVEPL